MERVVIYHSGKEVLIEDLGLPTEGHVPSIPPPPPSSLFGRPASQPPSSMTRRGDNVITGQPILLNLPEGGTTFDDLEREILAQVLQRAEGNQSRAARSLGLSESTLRSRLKRLGLKS
jgi:DNA-binding NtrC family response regulator